MIMPMPLLPGPTGGEERDATDPLELPEGDGDLGAESVDNT